MTIEMCYNLMDADYKNVLERLMNDKLVYKYNKKFADSKDYDNLVNALAAKDYGVAFRMAHNLKGMSANLAYSGLQRVSSDLCEELRGGEPKIDVGPLMDSVTQKYNQVIEYIALMDEV